MRDLFQFRFVTYSVVISCIVNKSFFSSLLFHPCQINQSLFNPRVSDSIDDSINHYSIHESVTKSVIQSFIQSVIQSFIPLVIQSFIHQSVNRPIIESSINQATFQFFLRSVHYVAVKQQSFIRVTFLSEYPCADL